MGPLPALQVVVQTPGVCGTGQLSQPRSVQLCLFVLSWLTQCASHSYYIFC